MHFSATLVVALTLSFFSDTTLARRKDDRLNTEGINCHGNRQCSRNMVAMDEITYYINKPQFGFQLDRLFERRQLIVCDYFGFICAYLMDTQEKITGKVALDLINSLYDHGCKACGSIPVAWPNNDVRGRHWPAVIVDKIGTATDAGKGYMRPYCRGVCHDTEFIGVPLGQPKHWPEDQNLALSDHPRDHPSYGREPGTNQQEKRRA